MDYPLIIAYGSFAVIEGVIFAWKIVNPWRCGICNEHGCDDACLNARVDAYYILAMAFVGCCCPLCCGAFLAAYRKPSCQQSEDASPVVAAPPVNEAVASAV
jgi:hypothetical protein